jgi:hypothetical protein
MFLECRGKWDDVDFTGPVFGTSHIIFTWGDRPQSPTTTLSFEEGSICEQRVCTQEHSIPVNVRVYLSSISRAGAQEHISVSKRPGSQCFVLNFF